MKFMVSVLLVLIAPLALFAATPKENAAGVITGTISPAAKCSGVEALSRNVPDPRKPQVFAGQYDAATGKFTIPNLPDGAYDLRIKIDGGTIEGVDLRQDKSDDDREFGDADRKEILDKITNYQDDFMDTHRALCLTGNGSHAKALVENIRNRDFHTGEKGEIIWRVEIWLYDYYNGGWVRRQHGWQVVARIRTGDKGDTSNESFRNLLRLFDPKLGGVEVAGGGTVSDFCYNIPDKLDSTMGKTAERK
jgi:hypothetical protein